MPLLLLLLLSTADEAKRASKLDVSSGDETECKGFAGAAAAAAADEKGGGGDKDQCLEWWLLDSAGEWTEGGDVAEAEAPEEEWLVLVLVVVVVEEAWGDVMWAAKEG